MSIARELSWRITNVDGDIKWTASTKIDRRWAPHFVDFSFVLYAGTRGGLCNKNAVLIVRKKEPGKKTATKVLLRKEFYSSYDAKNFIDALLFTTRFLFLGKPLEEAEEWFIEQLNKCQDAEAPEPSNPEYVSSHLFRIAGFPC